jgi:hypothetical protein
MKASYLLALCLSGIITLIVTYPSQGGDSRSLSMDVHVLHARPGQLEMDVAFTNIGKRPIPLYQDDLPWEFRYSLHIVIARGFPGREGVLEEVLPVVDPGSSEKVELQPGQTLRGKISLNKRFPALAEETRNRGLYIFWVYEVTPMGSSSVERLGGWTFVEKEVSRSPVQR